MCSLAAVPSRHRASKLKADLGRPAQGERLVHFVSRQLPLSPADCQPARLGLYQLSNGLQLFSPAVCQLILS